MFNFNPGGFNQLYDNWMKQMQQMPGVHGNQGVAANPMAFGFSGVNPFAGLNGNANQTSSPFANYWQGLGAIQQAIDSLRQFAPSGLPTAAAWMGNPVGYGAAGAGHSPFAGFTASNPMNMGYDANALGARLARIQQISTQIFGLLDSSSDLKSTRRELVELIRQLSDTLFEEINNFSANFLTVQFINNTRSFLAYQNKLTREQLVQASITPWRGNVESYQHSCNLWQQVCESTLGMIDVYQQFTEVFNQSCVDSFIARIDEDDFTLKSAEEVVDLFVKLYEEEFGKLLRSDNFSKSYGEMINFLMQARLDQQQYIDKTVESFGLPSKREMDSSHKKLHKHNKDLRSIQQQLGEIRKAVEQVDKLADDAAKTASQMGELQTRCAKHSKELQGQQDSLESVEKKTGEVQKKLNDQTQQLAGLNDTQGASAKQLEQMQTNFSSCSIQLVKQQEQLEKLTLQIEKLSKLVDAQQAATQQDTSLTPKPKQKTAPVAKDVVKDAASSKPKP